MSVTKSREKVVDFADPYFYDFGMVAVPKDSPVQTLAELAGKEFCVGASTTYEQWLNGTLEIVDPNMKPVPEGVKVTTLPTDNECIQAIAAGRTFDALAANENSLANAVKENQPIRILDDSVTFTISVSPALDKSGPSTASMLVVLNKVTRGHACRRHAVGDQHRAPRQGRHQEAVALASNPAPSPPGGDGAHCTRSTRKQQRSRRFRAPMRLEP